MLKQARHNLEAPKLQTVHLLSLMVKQDILNTLEPH